LTQAETKDPKASSQPSPPTEGESLHVNRAFWIVFASCCVLSLFLIWGFRYLPMTDLPQHAAQLSILVHYNDLAYDFQRQFELNWTTPYLLSFALAWPFVGLGIVPALKVLISLAIIGFPASFLWLCGVLKRSPWWSLLGFPLAYNFSFYFGFLTFILTIPLALIQIGLTLRYVEQPSFKGGLRIAIIGVLLYPAHGLLFAMCLGLTCAMLALSSPTIKTAISRQLLMLPSVLFAVAWGRFAWKAGSSVHHADVWHITLDRLWDLPGLLLGYGKIDVLASAVGLLLLAIPWLAGSRFSSQKVRWIPLLAVLVAYAFFPFKLRGVSFLNQRFAVFVLPFVLLATEVKKPLVRPSLVRLIQGSAVACWLFLLCARFYGFDVEAKSFNTVMAHMPTAPKVRPLIFRPDSEFIPGGVPYLHFPVYIQAEKGGVTGFSFAIFYSTFAHYRPEFPSPMNYDEEWQPQRFSWANEHKKYDTYVVRAPINPAPMLFRGARTPIYLVAQQGWWWVYQSKQPNIAIPNK
jgi:hypothetical protein